MSLFGHLRARLADEPLALSAATGRLLAYALLHIDRSIPRRQAALALWPDVGDPDALGRLRRQLHALNELARSSGAAHPWIAADRLTIQWNDAADYWFDVQEFDACSRAADPASTGTGRDTAEGVLSDLERAAELYTGDLLEDWFDDWVLLERESRRSRFGQILARLVGLYAQRGDAGAAADSAARLVQLDDLRETAHRWLVGLTYAAGDRDGALAAYDECCRVLSTELDVKPMPATEQMAQAIRDRRPPERVLALLRSELPEAAGLLEAARRRLPHNLPEQLTSFVGRERELESLAEKLREDRFVTVIGPGGSGKSRLALELAEIALSAGAAATAGDGTDQEAPGPQFPDGVWWVDLASISEPAIVAHAAAAAMGVAEEPGEPLVDTLTRHVTSRQLLLVIDNCEHLRDPAAELADALLDAGPGVVVLATSRVPLPHPRGSRWPIPPLTLPPPDETAWPAAVIDYEAPRLFAARAAAVAPGFAATRENSGAVLDICRRLDGMPLAIELAAARIKVLSAAEVSQRLDDRFRLLTGGPRTAVPQQRTLRAMMDWSYDLLDQQERRLLQRLSVFRGGWTMESAEDVCRSGAAADGVADVLAGLVEQSLVSAAIGTEPIRYRMLETVREYASERLATDGEQDRFRDRHLQHFLALAEQADEALRGPEQAEWLTRLEAEKSNLRAALQWSLGPGREEGAALRLATALRWFWYFRSYLDEGRSWLVQAIEAERSAPEGLRAKALNAAGTLAFRQGDFSAALSHFERSRDLLERAGDVLGVGLVLGNLGLATSHLGDMKAARSFHERSLAIALEHGDRRAAANALGNLGHLAIDLNDFDAAASYVERQIALERELGNAWGLAAGLAMMGRVAKSQGDYDSSRRLITESIALYEQLGDDGGAADVRMDLASVEKLFREYGRAQTLYEASLAAHRRANNRAGIATALFNLGSLWLERDDQRDLAASNALLADSLVLFAKLGDRLRTCASLIAIGQTAAAGNHLERATRLLGAAERIREEAGFDVRGVTDYEFYISEVRDALGDAAFEAAWAAGKAMTLEEAIAYAVAEPTAETG